MMVCVENEETVVDVTTPAPLPAIPPPDPPLDPLPAAWVYV
jgi:hypothetical protein